MPDYPEHEKLKAIADQSQVCGEFLDWLAEERGYVLANVDTSGESYEGRLWPVHVRHTELLAGFFGIDLDKIEREKRAMLDAQREANEKSLDNSGTVAYGEHMPA